MFVASIALLLAATETPAAATPGPEAEPVASKKICRRSVDTGTRLGGRMVCMTKEQWERHSRETQEQFNRNVGTRTRS